MAWEGRISAALDSAGRQPHDAAAGAVAGFSVVLKSETHSHSPLGGNSKRKLSLAVVGGSHRERVAGFAFSTAAKACQDGQGRACLGNLGDTGQHPGLPQR